MRSALRPGLLVAVLLMTTLAGCFGDEPAPVIQEPEPEPPAPVDIRTLMVETAECTQFTGGIVAAPQAYQAYVPEGFSMVRDTQSGTFVQLTVLANSCPAATDSNGTLGDSGSWAVFGVPVRVPEEHVDFNYSRNFVPIRVIASNDVLAERFAAWGFDMTEVGEFEMSEVAGPNRVTNKVLNIVATSTYTINAALGPVGDTFARNTFRMWAVGGDNVTGAILVDNYEGPRLGQGPQAFTSSDDVMPGQAGGIMTVGESIRALYRWIPAGAPNPPITWDSPEDEHADHDMGDAGEPAPEGGGGNNTTLPMRLF